MNVKPALVLLRQQPDQTGGNWEILAVYANGDMLTLATVAPFMSFELIRQVAGLIARDQGLDDFQEEDSSF